MLVFVIITVLIGATAYYYSQSPAAAIIGRMTAQPRLGFIGQNTWLQILSQVIPGFREAVGFLPGQNEAAMPGLARFNFSPLTGLRDPKNILAAQIPYMDNAEIQPDPLMNPPEGIEQPAQAPRQEPRIVLPLRNTADQGKIIIYHTHTTESFIPTSGRPFTDDLGMTVASLGKDLAEILYREYGIPVLHDNTIHDIPKRSGSYGKALTTVQKLLAENPDTRLVLDLHRDGVARSVSTLEINGRQAGRVLFIVGTNHSKWQENNKRAAFLQGALEELAPGITRGIKIVPHLNYNQHVHPGAMLIELGGYRNSLDEAGRILPYLAKAIADLYFSGM